MSVKKLIQTFFGVSLIASLSFAAEVQRVKPAIPPSLSLSSANQISTSGQLTLESFENEVFPPPGWSKITNFVADTAMGKGWQRIQAGETVLGFIEPAPADAPVGGGSAVAFASWATGAAVDNPTISQPTEQVLITPLIADIAEGDSLRFKLRFFATFGDNLDILLSTTVNDSIGAFETMIAQISFSEQAFNNWIEYSYALTDFVPAGSDIYIAFREHVDDITIEGDAILLDLVQVDKLVATVKQRQIEAETFSLHQNYPNPFNPSTTLSFSLAKSGRVTLRVYDIRGQEVRTLIDGITYQAGSHLVLFDASNLSSGVYYYRLEYGQHSITRKMAMIQ